MENAVMMINVVGKPIEDAKKELLALELGTKVTEEENADFEAGFVFAQDVAEGATIAKNSTINLKVSTGGTKKEEGITIADVKGTTESEAKAALEAQGFVVEATTENSDSVESGKVISQSPAGGESAEKGAKISIVVSAGPKTEKVAVPDLRGMTETSAKEKLAAEGFKCDVSEVHSDTVTAGCVVSQSNEPGTKVDKGTTIKIKLSVGPEKHTYKYVANIDAPTGYTGGNANIVITAADGTSRSFTTAAFPFAVNETGFNSPNGTVTITYTSQIEETVINPETGEQSVEKTQGQATSGPTAVQFTQE